MTRLAKLEVKIDSIEARIGSLEPKVDKLVESVATLLERVNHMPTTRQWLAGGAAFILAMVGVVIGIAQIMQK